MDNLKKIKVSNRDEDEAVPSVGKDKTLYAPSFSIDARQMPEIKNWQVGKKYYLTIEVEQTSQRVNEDSINSEFDITAYKHIKKKGIDEMSDEEFSKFQGKALDEASEGKEYVE